MSARKLRPKLHDPVREDMSLRDIASALGASTAELHRWQALAAIPQDQFEARLRHVQDAGERVSAARIIGMSTPVPARGRVQRALAIVKSMSPGERGALMAAMGVSA